MISVTKHIALIGYMGTGKTTVGLHLANKLGMKFVDTDQKIEDSMSCTISEIFSNYGEHYFRELETCILGKTLDGPPVILATGGGAILSKKNRELLKRKSIRIWLRTDNRTLALRLKRQSHLRPIIHNRSMKEIMNIYRSRVKYYRQCELAVDTSRKRPATIARIVIRDMEKKGVRL